MPVPDACTSHVHDQRLPYLVSYQDHILIFMSRVVVYLVFRVSFFLVHEQRPSESLTLAPHWLSGGRLCLYQVPGT